MLSSAGVLIDIDGVVLHGGKPFEWSKKAIHVCFANKSSRPPN
jgi:ribonucleotide monophosphatase NagD (HAD superfamily)